MKREMESECATISKYEEITEEQVQPSGLWVNPKYPWLGCSPDGLLGENGTVEIKTLKIFQKHNLKRVIHDVNNILISNDPLKQQCFRIEGDKCVLKTSHSYYYQVQMQLLVTERQFCDFVSLAKDGPPSIERIFRDSKLIKEILDTLTILWKQVIAPESFLK